VIPIFIRGNECEDPRKRTLREEAEAANAQEAIPNRPMGRRLEPTLGGMAGVNMPYRCVSVCVGEGGVVVVLVVEVEVGVVVEVFVYVML
jgi:hypothetical protein